MGNIVKLRQHPAQGDRLVLMIAFHYPPIAASAGALRTRAFASYLPDYGWHAHILTPSAFVYDECDEGAIVPPEAQVHRSWAFDAKRHLGWRGRYAAITATPDRWVSWVPSAIATGIRLIRRYPIEAIWSTYPIPTAHLIASALSRMSGLPWVAEFRDPLRPTGQLIQRRAQSWVERETMSRADHVVFVTPGAFRHAERRYPGLAARASVLPNGFDESLEPIDGLQRQPCGVSRPIRLLHSGYLYPEGRDPRALFDALQQLKKAGRIDASRLKVILRSSQHDCRYQNDINQRGIEDIVSLETRLPHDLMLQEQRAVDGLLLLQGKEFNLQVPAKLFEYLRTQRPILALVDRDGDTAALLDELKAGIRADADSVEAIATGIQRLLEVIESGQTAGIIPDNKRISGYSRQAITADLANLLATKTANCLA